MIDRLPYAMTFQGDAIKIWPQYRLLELWFGVTATPTITHLPGFASSLMKSSRPDKQTPILLTSASLRSLRWRPSTRGSTLWAASVNRGIATRRAIRPPSHKFSVLMDLAATNDPSGMIGWKKARSDASTCSHEWVKPGPWCSTIGGLAYPRPNLSYLPETHSYLASRVQLSAKD